MQKRILGLCTSLEMAEEIVDKCYELSLRLKAGVTLLYVKEEELFDLLIYENKDSNLDIVNEHFKRLFKERGIEDWVFFLKDSDIPDQVALEVERESSFMIITDYNDKISELLTKVKVPIYILVANSSHKPQNGLLTLDNIEAGHNALKLARQIEPKTVWRAYKDYQFFPTELEAGIDPVVGTIGSDILLEESSEILDIERRAFKEFCEEEGIEGDFEIGEVAISKDILKSIEANKSDLLLVATEDSDTILTQGIKALLSEIALDTIIYFENF